MDFNFLSFIIWFTLGGCISAILSAILFSRKDNGNAPDPKVILEAERKNERNRQMRLVNADKFIEDVGRDRERQLPIT